MHAPQPRYRRFSPAARAPAGTCTRDTRRSATSARRCGSREWTKNAAADCAHHLKSGHLRWPSVDVRDPRVHHRGGFLCMELFSDTVCPAGSLAHPTVGISSKLIAVNSLIEKPRLYCPGCHPFRDLARSGCSPSIIGCGLGRYLSAPSPEKRLPFRCPVVPPWSPAPGVRLRLSHDFAAAHLDLVG